MRFHYIIVSAMLAGCAVASPPAAITTPAPSAADAHLSTMEQRHLAHIQAIHAPGLGLVRRFRESGLLADSAEWWVAGAREVLPFAGSWRGIDGIAEFEKQLGAIMRYDKVEIREYLVSGNDVVAVFLGEGIARATGKPFRSEIVRVYSFAAGKVVRVRNYYDTYAYVRAVRGNTPADSAVIQELAAIRSAAQRAAAMKDSAAFSRYVTDDFAFIHSTGGRDDAARFLAYASRVMPDSMWFVRPNDYIITPDIVVRSGTTANRVAGRGTDTYHGVDVFVRSNGSWRWAFHQTTRVPRAPTPTVVDTATLDAYVGRYVASGGGAGYEITRQGDSLISTPLSGQGRSVLRPYTDASFFIDGVPATVVFLRDASGRVAFLEMHRRESVARFTKN